MVWSLTGDPWVVGTIVRVIVICLVILLAGGLMASGHDLATATLLALTLLGAAVEVARRASDREAAR